MIHFVLPVAAGFLCQANISNDLMNTSEIVSMKVLWFDSRPDFPMIFQSPLDRKCSYDGWVVLRRNATLAAVKIWKAFKDISNKYSAHPLEVDCSLIRKREIAGQRTPISSTDQQFIPQSSIHRRIVHFHPMFFLTIWKSQNFRSPRISKGHNYAFPINLPCGNGVGTV